MEPDAPSSSPHPNSLAVDAPAPTLSASFSSDESSESSQKSSEDDLGLVDDSSTGFYVEYNKDVPRGDLTPHDSPPQLLSVRPVETSESEISDDEEISFDLRRASAHTRREAADPQGDPRRFVAVTGRREYAFLDQISVPISCKLDTGALISALSARDIRFFSRAGRRYCRFRLEHGRTLSKSFILTCPLERTIKVKDINKGSQKAAGSDFAERPVVVLNCCLGRIPVSEEEIGTGESRGWKRIEFSLVDRSHFVHGMLIGVYAMRQFCIAVCPMRQYDYALSSDEMKAKGRSMRKGQANSRRSRQARGRGRSSSRRSRVRVRRSTPRKTGGSATARPQSMQLPAPLTPTVPPAHSLPASPVPTVARRQTGLHRLRTGIKKLFRKKKT